MPRKQNIYEENPMLQGLATVTSKLGVAAKDIKDAWQLESTSNVLEQVGKVRADAVDSFIAKSLQIGMKRVSELGKNDPAVKGIAINESLKPDEDKQDDKIASIADRILQDQRERDVLNYQLANLESNAQAQMQKVIALNAGVIGQMSPQQSATLGAMVPGNFPALGGGSDLSSIASLMKGGKGLGGSGGSGGSGSPGTFSMQKVKGADGVTRVVAVNNKTLEQVPLDSLTSNEGANGFKMQQGFATYQFDVQELARLDPASQQDYMKSRLSAFMKQGWVPFTDDQGRIVVTNGQVMLDQPDKVKTTGGGGGKGKNSYLQVRQTTAQKFMTARSNYLNDVKGAKTTQEGTEQALFDNIWQYNQATSQYRAETGDTSQNFWPGTTAEDALDNATVWRIARSQLGKRAGSPPPGGGNGKTGQEAAKQRLIEEQARRAREAQRNR